MQLLRACSAARASSATWPTVRPQETWRALRQSFLQLPTRLALGCCRYATTFALPPAHCYRRTATPRTAPCAALALCQQECVAPRVPGFAHAHAAELGAAANVRKEARLLVGVACTMQRRGARTMRCEAARSGSACRPCNQIREGRTARRGGATAAASAGLSVHVRPHPPRIPVSPPLTTRRDRTRRRLARAPALRIPTSHTSAHPPIHKQPCPARLTPPLHPSALAHKRDRVPAPSPSLHPVRHIHRHAIPPPPRPRPAVIALGGTVCLPLRLRLLTNSIECARYARQNDGSACSQVVHGHRVAAAIAQAPRARSSCAAPARRGAAPMAEAARTAPTRTRQAMPQAVGGLGRWRRECKAPGTAPRGRCTRQSRPCQIRRTPRPPSLPACLRPGGQPPSASRAHDSEG